MSKLAEIQEQLSERVKGHFLLHLFINDLRFLLAAMILLPIAIGGVLLIPKIWKITPEDFRPAIKVSGLDFLQSWALARSAREYEANEDYDQALYSWHVAVANIPTNIENLRSAIGTFLKVDRPESKEVQQNVNYSIWLLRLNKTNFNDLELIAQSLDRVRMDDLQFALLNPLEDRLTEPMRAAYAKSLFNLFRHNEFIAQWNQLSPETKAQPENALYSHSYEALWGSPDQAEKSLAELKLYTSNEAIGHLANQLLLLIHYHRKETSEYHAVLTTLKADQRDRYPHHLAYWTLLSREGRNDAALKAANRYDGVPSSAEDLVAHVNLYREMGELELADQLVREHIDSFPPEIYLFTTYADLLIQMSAWDRLRELAIIVRKATTQTRAMALSYYLEGRADFQQHRNNGARTAFQKFAELTTSETLDLGIGLANELFEIGFPNQAHQLLINEEENSSEDAAYWYSRSGSAFRIKNYEDMKYSAEKAVQLEPDNQNYKSALAESLLLLREDPARAVRLTLELASSDPSSFSHHINHVLALLLNERTEDAALHLGKIPLDAAPDSQAEVAFHYARFGVAFQQERYEEAQNYAKEISEPLLSDREREYFNACRDVIRTKL